MSLLPSYIPPYPVIVKRGDLVQTQDGYAIVQDIDGPDNVLVSFLPQIGHA